VADTRPPLRAAWEAVRECREALMGVHRFGGVTLLGQYLVALARSWRHVLRARSLKPADARMQPRLCRVRCGSATARLSGESFGFMREILGRQVYWPDPRLQIGPTDLIVDCGANVGTFTVPAAAMAVHGRVVALECQGGFVARLRENVQANGFDRRVTILHAVIGPETGWFAEAHGTDGSHYTGAPRPMSLAEVVRETALSRIDFLKMDIEGSEFAAFRETDGWLPLVRRLAMEVHLNCGTPEWLEAILRRQGFVTWTASRVRHVRQYEVSMLYAVRP
jgi:FkbM family methyltransferase